MSDVEVTPLAAPDRPDPNDLISSTWGRWVQDHEAGPRQFRLWRTSNMALGTDGGNAVTFENKIDPYSMCDTMSSFTAPTDGLVLFTGMLSIQHACTALTGTVSIMRLFQGSTELRRGTQLNIFVNTTLVVGSVLSSIVPVTAGQRFTVDCYASAVGVVKTLLGGGTPFNCYLEGVYLTAPV